MEEYWRGAARMMVSKGSSFEVSSPVSELAVLVLTEYLDLCFEIEVTVVLRRVVALEALSMPAKICQLPPSICIAPLMAMHTIVSRACIVLRFCP